jgi:L-fuconolactonase
MIVDAHQHFWSAPLDRYPWMTDEVAAIRRPFGPEDLAPLLKANRVDRTVVVQARMDLDETYELLGLATATSFVSGVVGWVDLTDPEVSTTLGDLKSGPNGAKLVGIRHQVQDEGDPKWLLRPDVRRGIAAVGDAGLVYDLLVKTRELPAAVEAVRQLPQVRFVIDHLAKPPIRRGDVNAWERGIRGLADQPNVHCKLSGMVTEAEWATWRPEQMRSFVQHVVEWFGPERCLFGSDWPVCLLAASYEQVIEVMSFCLTGIGSEETAWIMEENARRLYRLV